MTWIIKYHKQLSGESQYLVPSRLLWQVQTLRALPTNQRSANLIACHLQWQLNVEMIDFSVEVALFTFWSTNHQTRIVRGSCAFMQIYNMEALLHAMTQTKRHGQFGPNFTSKTVISLSWINYLTVLTIRSTNQKWPNKVMIYIRTCSLASLADSTW